MRGYIELARQEASGDSQTTLSVSYTETATLPSMSYTLIADDIADPPPCREDIVVPVSGTGTSPSIEITADWEIETVVPERYRLIKGDDQTVTITATASDSEGIEYLTIFLNGVPHDFTYGGETSVSETLTWINSELSRTRFYFSANARDMEGNTSTAHGESYDIAAIEDIEFLWNAALGFHNFSTDRLSWTRMVQVFGEDECWLVEEWDWKNPWAQIYYHAGFKEIAKHGHCFGFSTLSNEIYNGRILARDIEYPLAAHQLSKTNSYTKEYLEARQAAQLGNKVMIARIDQWVTWGAEVGLHLRLLRYIERDLESDQPGIIEIREDDGGHAIVPWMTRHMSDGTTRVYVYDSNYVLDGATLDGIHNAGADFNNFDHFPFMEFRFNDWSYAFSWDSTLNQPNEIWDDKLLYYTYEQALGDRLHENQLGDASDAPYVTDQTIPSVIDYLIGVFAGAGDAYFEDEKGRVTGIQNGKLKEEIPGSMAMVPMMGGSFTDHEMYAVPANTILTINIVGKENGDYTLGLLGEHSLYSIEEKSIRAGTTDMIRIEPYAKAVEYRLRLLPGSTDDDFTVRFANKFQGKVAALGHDYIGREYILEQLSVGEDDGLLVHIEEGGDSR